jgi:hypothetical protein
MKAAAPLRVLGVRTALAALLATLVAGVGASPGHSFDLTPTCPGNVERPFLPWLDVAGYTLASGGDFEGRQSWTLTGAKVVRGNETFRVHGASDERSLAISGGGSATTPTICAGLGEPTLRFFAVGGDRKSRLDVEVVARTLLGTSTIPIGSIAASDTWRPTLPLLILGNITGLTSLDGLTTTVQLRFRAVGRATWQIDDVYVDPWKIH